MKNELLIPTHAARDVDAVEMARVWIAERGLHCSLRIGIYEKRPDVDEVNAWGIVLADIARHITNGWVEKHKTESKEEILDRITQSFLRELSKPTSLMRGEFANKSKN